MFASPDPLVTLIRLLRQGNEAAFERLMDWYGPRLTSYCLRFTKAREPAEEIVQDVFVNLWLRRATLDERSSLSGYLFKSTQNAAFNFLKKAARDATLQEQLWYDYQQQEASGQEEAPVQELAALVSCAIYQLPPKRRNIFQMSRQGGMTYEEIAEELNISKNTVKEQIARASRAIRDFLRVHTDIALLLSCLFGRGGKDHRA